MPHDKPTLKLGARYGEILETRNLVNYSNIVYRKEYKFFIPRITVNSVSSITNLDIKDTLRVYDGSSLKFQAGIR